MTSVDSYFKFSVWQSTWGWTPFPPSTCVHLSLTPSPLRVDVINGWPLTYNSLRSSQPTYLRELFTIQPTRSTRSSSCFTLSRPPVTSHLMFSNRAISITAPRLWNDLPPELRTISSPAPPSLPITRHHLHLPLYPSPQGFHSKLKSHLFNHSYPDPSDHLPPLSVYPSIPFPISTTPTLTATLSPSGTLEIGPELLLTPVGTLPFDSSQRS